MTRAFSRLLLVGAVLVAVACDEEMIGLDQGTSSTLDVRAYVDADGNGSFDSGSDTPIASATVSLTGGETQLSETTGNDGVASFSGLAPGSYQLSFSGDLPDGSILATASSPTVVAPFRGESLSAEFRYAFLPGDLSGVVFRDDNENGELDDEDTPAPGLPVAIFTGATAAGEPMAEAITDANGSFLFTTLRPGTYTLQFTPFPTIEIVGGNTRTVTVQPDARGDVPVQFTGNLVVDISEARNAASGSVVTVEGVVTWQTQWDSRVYFLQDGTGGISTFDFNGPDLEIGDEIRITGQRGSFRGEVQVSPVNNLTALGHPGAPDPTTVTAARINAGDFQGMLVTLDGTVVSVDADGFDNQTVTLADPAGDEFLVFSDSRSGTSSDMWEEGEPYAVTGVLGTDDRNALAHRVEPRFPEDIVRGGSSVTIAEARAQEAGTSATVEGVITWQTEWDGRVYFLQDETGGISTFDFNAPDLQRGDRVRLRGELGAFRGETQLSPVDFATVIGSPGVPDPRGVTGEEINAGEFQGELVTITGTVTGIEEVNSFGTQLVTAEDEAGTSFNIFIDNRTGALLTEGEDEGQTFTFTGVLGTDDRDDPGPRLEVRDSDDVQ